MVWLKPGRYLRQAREDAKGRGPMIVRRPGEVRAVIARMLPWYVTAFSAAIGAGALLETFWWTAALAIPLALLAAPPVRGLTARCLGTPQLAAGWRVLSAVVGLAAVAGVAEIELQRRAAELQARWGEMAATARQAFAATDCDAIQPVTERYGVLPGQPLVSLTVQSTGAEDAADAPSHEAVERFLAECRDHFMRARVLDK